MVDKRFEAVFHEHNRMVSSYLYSLMGNWEEAVDLTQETFLTAYRRQAEFDPSRPVGPWLRGIARNLARNSLRKKNRHRQFLVDGTEIDNLYALFDSGMDDLWEDRLAALDWCIERLPNQQGKAVNLFYRSGMTARSVAESLGVLEGTVFHLMWLARKNLRKCIEAALGLEEATNGT